MGDEHRLRRDRVAVDAPRPRPGATTASITPPMCSTSSRVPWKALLAVTAPSTSQIGWTPRSRAARGALDHERRGAHAEDHAVAALVERQRGFGDVLVGGGRAGGEESGADPAEQLVAGDVVGGDTITTRRQRPARIQSSASATAWVVLAQAELTCVFGPAGADELGELRVAHRQDAEQEPAVELVRLVARARAAASWMRRSISASAAPSPSASATRCPHGLAARPARCAAGAGRCVVAVDLVGQLVVAREGAERRSTPVSSR